MEILMVSLYILAWVMALFGTITTLAGFCSRKMYKTDAAARLKDLMEHGAYRVYRPVGWNTAVGILGWIWIAATACV